MRIGGVIVELGVGINGVLWPLLANEPNEFIDRFDDDDELKNALLLLLLLAFAFAGVGVTL